MAGYGEPGWLNPQTDPHAATQEAETGGTIKAPPPTNNDEGGKGSWTLVALSFADFGLAVMMGGLGVLTLIEVHNRKSTKDISEPFLAAYMIMFATLLFSYEFMWWMPAPGINKSLRRNFGFMYGLRGKGLYLIFVAFLCLGLGKDASVRELNWATGIAYLIVGCLHILVVCSYPEVAIQYVAPSAGLTADDPENVV
mmetsp:Transcript_27722/g.77671  ORF Transcript_27722/g.77671 Transcript_27722/m.77671 type:complete len:197 (+) Transcript_27722:85-675(+)